LAIRLIKAKKESIYWIINNICHKVYSDALICPRQYHSSAQRWVDGHMWMDRAGGTLVSARFTTAFTGKEGCSSRDEVENRKSQI
jgi:hypothetical protein